MLFSGAKKSGCDAGFCIFWRIFIIFSILTMTFQFRNRPYVTQGVGDPQSVVNFLSNIKGYLTHQSLRVVDTYNYVRFKSHHKKSYVFSAIWWLCFQNKLLDGRS